MYHPHDFLKTLAIVLGVAAIITLIFQKLRQPVILGYLIAGMIIGPHIPIPIIADTRIVHTLSELGVIFLMFSLGLEFSIRKLIAIFPTAGIIAITQCSFMIWIGYMAGRALGWTPIESIYTGAILAISSTTIIVKAFSEENIKGKVAHIVFSVLIVEDLIAALIIAILTPLSTSRVFPSSVLTHTTLTLVLFLIAFTIGGLLIIPRLMRFALKDKRAETALITSVGICFSLSLLVKEFGYSEALGAFLAGSLMAESGEENYLSTLIHPLRDMFAAVFFVSVGMLIDPHLMLTHWKAILLLTGLVIVGKFIGVTLGTFLSGHDTRTSVRAGMSLAQIGEFSFIIAAVGLSTKSTREFLYPVAVGVSAITTLTTPWLIRSSDQVARFIDRHLPNSLQTFVTLYGTWIQKLRQAPGSLSRTRHILRLLLLDAVIFVGITIGSTVLIEHGASALTRFTGLSARVTQPLFIGIAILLSIPFMLGMLRCARSLGIALARQVFPLEQDELDRALAPRRLLIVTLQLMIVFAVGMLLLAITQPFLPFYYGLIPFILILTILGIQFWKNAISLQGHVRAGAEMVIEAIKTSLVSTQPEKENERMQAAHLLPGLGVITRIRLHPSSQTLGKTLSELDLRGMTGASVIAITRGNTEVVVPTGKERLESNDILALTGTEEAIESAIAILNQSQISTT